MKITTFANPTTSSYTKNIFGGYNFHKLNEPADYSALLDDIIADNIIATNTYLKKANDDALIHAMAKEANKKYITLNGLKDSDIFAIAAKYIAGFGKKLPYTLGHTYYFDGTPIIFHLDSIEIDGEEFFYDDFNDIEKILFPKKNKKLIIDIYTKGNTNININIK